MLTEINLVEIKPVSNVIFCANVMSFNTVKTSLTEMTFMVSIIASVTSLKHVNSSNKSLVLSHERT